jgi:hypothetical protein
MCRMIASVVALSMTLSVAPMFAAAPRGAQGQTASLAGTATSNSGQALANTTVQLRNLATGQLTGTTTSSATGTFSFAGLPAGNFAVEVVNAAGQIIGTSASVTVAAGATITGITVSATAAIAAGAAGAAAAGAAAGAGLGTTAIVTIVAVAAGAGIAGAVAIANNNASPSR